MRRGWELLLLLIIFAYVIKAAIEMLTPLVPYMLIAGLVALIGMGYVRRNREW